MGAVEDFSAYVAGEGLFVQLQRLLVEHNFMGFAHKIRPALDKPNLHNRDVFVMLLKDALDCLGPNDMAWEVNAIEVLANAYLPGYAEPVSAIPEAVTPSTRAVSFLTSGTIQLRRVVQVTTYGCAGFEDSDQAGIKHTVYRSPQERTFHRAVQLRYPGLFALPNYPLASAINTDWLRHVVSRRVFAFTLRSALDVLLVTPGEGDPIIGFELDSKYHDEPAARLCDKMKDEVMHLAGIPLVRLRTDASETMTVDDWYAVLSDQVGEMPVPQRHRCREQALSFVPTNCSANVSQ